MVTLESNRGQSSTALPFKHQTQAVKPAAEAVTEQPQAEQHTPVPLHEPLWFMSLVVSGATIGSMWGLAAVILAILGLSGVQPTYTLPVAGIVLGLAFLAWAESAPRGPRMFRIAEHENSRDRIVFFSGVTAASIAGLVAIVLGLMNLVFLGDVRFGGVSVIAMGLGLLWHSGAMRRVSQFAHDVTYRGLGGRLPSGPFAMNALSLAPLRDVLVGLGGVILGVLAMMHIAPVTLEFVALLAMGAALTATASTICGAAMSTLKGICEKS